MILSCICVLCIQYDDDDDNDMMMMITMMMMMKQRHESRISDLWF